MKLATPKTSTHGGFNLIWGVTLPTPRDLLQHLSPTNPETLGTCAHWSNCTLRTDIPTRRMRLFRTTRNYVERMLRFMLLRPNCSFIKNDPIQLKLPKEIRWFYLSRMQECMTSWINLHSERAKRSRSE